VRLFFRVSSTILLACGTVSAALCQSATLATSGIPSLASCSVPAGKEPWRDAHQSPECRTLEVIHSMSLPEKLQRLDSPSGAQTGAGENLLKLRAADGPNGIARGPFPGPPPPSAIGVTAFPNEIVVASTWDRDMAAQFGTALAEEWRGKGLSEIIGPTLNIMRTWHWGRSAETYGEDPFLTGEMASAEVAALQSQHVVAMVKHFVANNQDWDRVGHFPDFTGINEIISERALHEIYYPGFRAAVEKSSAGAAMCSYNQINGTFACNNKDVLPELRSWGLTGDITPDAVFALHDPLLAIGAGVDHLGFGVSFKALYDRGQINEQVIDRVLFNTIVPMFKVGVFDHPPTGAPANRVSTPQHIALAKRLIEEGSVLLKNKDHLLPLTPDKVKTIALIGVAAGPDAITGEQGPMVYVEKLSVPAEAIIQRAGSSMKVTYVKAGAGIRPLPILRGDAIHDSTGQEAGFTASYFRSGDLSGQPVATRVDPAVDFDHLPASELGKEVFSFAPPTLSWSARWTGTLDPPLSGDYVFSLDGGGSTTLAIDGKPVVQQHNINFTSTALGTIHLDAGKPVSLVLEHSNDYALLGSQVHLGWFPPHKQEMSDALQAAHSADVAVVFAGEQLGEGMDKQALNLPGDQDAWIEAVAAQNPHTVVVLNTSTPVAMPWLEKVGAVLETWYPGQESGAGTASLLFGDADPGGRLPITFAASPDQGPATQAEEYPGVNGVAHYNEGIFVGYRWYDEHHQEPLFPFGFGLSYTTFRFSDLRSSRDGDTVKIELTVKNVGSRPGSDVVQVYVGEPAAAEEPPSQLKGFTKVSLRPGEGKHVTIAVPSKSLASWSEQRHRWELSPGTYEIKVGESSREFRLHGQVTLEAASF
jgi:beta-glucosidase